MTNEEILSECFKELPIGDYDGKKWSYTILKAMNLVRQDERDKEKPSKQLKYISDEDAIKINDLLHITRKPEYKLNKSDKIRQGKDLAEALHYTNGSWMVAPGCILHIASYLQSKGYQLPIQLDLPTKEKPKLYFKGKGEHSVRQLETICKNLEEQLHLKQIKIQEIYEIQSNKTKEKPLTKDRIWEIILHNLKHTKHGIYNTEKVVDIIFSEMQPKQLNLKELSDKDIFEAYPFIEKALQEYSDEEEYQISYFDGIKYAVENILQPKKVVSEDKWISIEDIDLEKPIMIGNAPTIPIVYLMLLAIKNIFGYVPQFEVKEIINNGTCYGVIANDLDNNDRWGFTFDEGQRFELSINSNKMNVNQVELVKTLIGFTQTTKQ